jgi:CheY-like chemotaxis protein
MRLCRLMGGGITVDSAPGRGTVFSATFEVGRAEPDAATECALVIPSRSMAGGGVASSPPIDEAAGVAPGSGARRMDTGNDSPFFGSASPMYGGGGGGGGSAESNLPASPPPLELATGTKVLLVDDSRVNLSVLQRLLTRIGVPKASMTAVTSGEDALEAVRRDAFDLVLMDVTMPGMDGYEATRELRRLEAAGTLAPGRDSARRACVAGLSAHALDKYREQGMESGMDAYLTKPVTMEALRGVIETIATLR